MKVLYLIPGPKEGNSFIFSKREVAALSKLPDIDVYTYYLDTKKIHLFIHELFKLRKFIMGNNFDLIHAQYGSICGVIACFVSRGRKLVVTYRGSDINGSSDVSLIRRRISVLLSYVSLLFADGCIFVSDRLRVNAPQIFQSSIVIPSGVDICEFTPEDQLQNLESLKLDITKKYLLFFSSYESVNKRPDLAKAAVERLHKSGNSNIELISMNGTVSSSLMPKYMNASDVLLMLSDKEGSPTVVQEALATGTPVVAVVVGDTDIMLDGVANSRIVERDPELIASGVMEVLRIGKIKPDKNVLSRFDFNECVSNIHKYYRSLF